MKTELKKWSNENEIRIYLNHYDLMCKVWLTANADDSYKINTNSNAIFRFDRDTRNTKPASIEEAAKIFVEAALVKIENKSFSNLLRISK